MRRRERVRCDFVWSEPTFQDANHGVHVAVFHNTVERVYLHGVQRQGARSVLFWTVFVIDVARRFRRITRRAESLQTVMRLPAAGVLFFVSCFLLYEKSRRG